MAESDLAVWAEIEWVVLNEAGRPATSPPETRATPYVARARGMAVSPEVGQEAEVVTVTGRRLRGRVRGVLPGYHHSFGSPLPEWIAMRESIRSLGRELLVAERGDV